MIGDGLTPTEELTGGTCRVPPHSSLHRHSHAATEIYYILSGSGVVDLAGTAHDVGVGAMVFIPSHCAHGITNTGSVELEFVFIYAADSIEDERTTYA
ncbi:cupin domain-containing protein [Streptomyces sp. NPDC060054]|nr:cupin domain-containing protein [Streptomyces sp. TSRI0281]